jgi:DNA-binding XRE family transcriptional regulator
MPSNFDQFVKREEARRGEEFAGRIQQAEEEFALSWQLRARRLELGLTQTALAERCGIPQSEISRIESGAANPTLATVMALSASLGVRVGLTES